MDKIPSMDKHKMMYKGQTPPWKETYRKRCQERLKKSRDSFLKRFRQGCSFNKEDSVDKVMAEEWKALGQENPDLQDHYADTNYIISIFEEIRSELVKEEQQILADYEASLQHEETMADASSHEKVICPVCKKNPLLQNKSVIFCYCGIRIDTETDCVTLAMVQENLESGLSQHNVNCSEEPVFNQADISGIGIQNILLTCEHCQMMHIIV